MHWYCLGLFQSNPCAVEYVTKPIVLQFYSNPVSSIPLPFLAVVITAEAAYSVSCQEPLSTFQLSGLSRALDECHCPSVRECHFLSGEKKHP